VTGAAKQIRVGYARATLQGGQAEPYAERLRRAGCTTIFLDRDVSSRTSSELVRALAFVDAGCTLVVVNLHQLGRSFKHLIDTIVALTARQVGLIVLDDQLDTTDFDGPAARVFTALADFEQAAINERNSHGLAKAREHGRLTGRPRLLDGDRLRLAEAMYSSGRYTAAEIARTFDVSKATLYRNIAELRRSEVPPADPHLQHRRGVPNA
jgi:DNA invertase Pin-like site-specific DNA recombinase